jgi:uncharacterized cupin superfamily protein
MTLPNLQLHSHQRDFAIREAFLLETSEIQSMHKVLTAGIVVICSMITAAARAEVIKPVKDSRPDIAGAIFERKSAVNEHKGRNATTDVVTFTSKDSAFQTGLFKSGPEHEVISGPHGFPYNEFLYFISGGATLTSADGSVMVVNAGEAVTIPKGWTGLFDTRGYTKMYVTYDSNAVKK